MRTAAAQKSGYLSIEAARQEYADKARTVAAQQDLANMAEELKSTEDIKSATLKVNLGLIQDQVEFHTLDTREAKAALAVEETRARTAVRANEFARFINPVGVARAENAAAIRAERMKVMPEGFTPEYPGQTVHRDLSGAVISAEAYATSPDAYGQTGSPSDPWGVSGRYRRQLPGFARHMPGPTHMADRFAGFRPSELMEGKPEAWQAILPERQGTGLTNDEIEAKYGEAPEEGGKPKPLDWSPFPSWMPKIKMQEGFHWPGATPTPSPIPGATPGETPPAIPSPSPDQALRDWQQAGPGRSVVISGHAQGSKPLTEEGMERLFRTYLA